MNDSLASIQGADNKRNRINVLNSAHGEKRLGGELPLELSCQDRWWERAIDYGALSEESSLQRPRALSNTAGLSDFLMCFQ